jgi:hypothetical protein
MDTRGFDEVMQQRVNERTRFGAAINRLALARQRLASVAGGVATSSSNASFGDDVLAGAGRLSNISDSLTSALQANADSIARTEKELQDAQSRERLILIVIIVGVVFTAFAAVVWLFY